MDRPDCATLDAKADEPSPGSLRAHELAGTRFRRGLDRLLGRLQARDVALPDPCAGYRPIRTIVGRVSADAGWRQLQHWRLEGAGGTSDCRRQGECGLRTEHQGRVVSPRCSAAYFLKRSWMRPEN